MRLPRDPQYIPRAERRRPRSDMGLSRDFPGADYTPEEVEFLRAISAFKALRRRPNPTAREILAIVRALGYRKEAR